MEAARLGARIDRARADAKLSLRELADLTGISPLSLSRIFAGDRIVTMPELILLAEATGTTVGSLATTKSIQQRVRYAVRPTTSTSMEIMQKTLLGYLELADYLDDQGIADHHCKKESSPPPPDEGQRRGA